ncbi:MAG: proteasome-activating nucleotidase [Hadesarchaea archaeon]|nr:proteasome-activating nucleotidase [Hadesarchaea archaeon]
MTESSQAKTSEVTDETYLDSYVKHLEQRIRGLERERRSIETEYMRLEREVQNLRSEFNRLTSPPLIEATLVDLLSDGRAVVRSSTGPRFVVNVSGFVNRAELRPGTRVALNQRTFNVVEVLPSRKDPLVLGMEVDERPSVTYEDIGGLEEQISEIRETVELPLLKPELFEKVGVEPPHGVLLYGPPGTGKTLVARAVAHESKATFIRLIGSELVQKFIGEGARMVREMFELAREKAPSIVFIDEIDAIAASRMSTSTSGDREVHRTMMQLLAELDGFDPRGNIKILAATNRPDILDRALLRPGRFDRLIEFPMPDVAARRAIFMIHTRRMNLSKDVDINKMAEQAEGATGADIKSICTEAGMNAIREGREQVTASDFQRALSKVLSTVRDQPRSDAMFW